VLDLVSGSWPGTIHIFPGLGGGKFGKGRVLVPELPLHDGDRYKSYGYSTLQAGAVEVADWDADGDVDLVVGTISGKVYLLPNEGTARKARFGKPVVLVTPGAGHYKTGPCVADWDVDGGLDLIVASESRGIRLHRNVGTREKPELAPPVDLKFGRKPWGLGYRPKPFVQDVNGDGHPDMLVGICLGVKDENGKRRTRGYVYLCLRVVETGR
jgi:hypothetical protein